MAVFETWLAYDLQKPLKPVILDGAMFTQDNMANRVGVVLTNGGEPVTITENVSGRVILSDGTTVPIVSGTKSGNKASILLPQPAYAVPGQIIIVIKLAPQSGDEVTTIGCAVAFVQRSTTGTYVDPGTLITDIDALISEIQTAIGSIPADLTELMAAIAPTFSDSTVYTAGKYVWYAASVSDPAKLYRFTADHAAGSWIGTDATLAGVGTDLAAFRVETRSEYFDGANLIKKGFTEPVIHNAGNTVTVTRNVTVAEWGCSDATEVSGTMETGNTLGFYIGGVDTDFITGVSNISVADQLYTSTCWIKNNHSTNSVFVRTRLPYTQGYTEIEPGKSVKIEQVANGDGTNRLQINFKPESEGDAFDVTIWRPCIKIGTDTNVGEYVPPTYPELTGQPTEDALVGFGESFTVSQVKTDALGNVESLTERTIFISDSEVTASKAGLMSPEDKAKLDAVSSNYGECSTAATGQNKVVNITGINSLSNGLSVRVFFVNAQMYEGTPKLNVSGTGAKEIKRSGGQYAGKYEWAAGEVVDFVYNLGDWYIVSGTRASQYEYGKTVLSNELTSGDTNKALTPYALNTYARFISTGVGVYTPSFAYVKGDKARNGSAVYVCTAPTTGDWDYTKWQLVPPILDQIDNINVKYRADCATAGNTAMKLISIPGEAFVGSDLTNGAVVFVRFKYAQTYDGDIMLRANNKDGGAIYLNSTDKAGLGAWGAGDTLAFLWDKTESKWYIVGGIASTSAYGRTKLEDSTESTSQSTALTPKSLNDFAKNIVTGADPYDDSYGAHYSVGSYCRKDGKLYKCTTAIAHGEEWDASHWVAVSPLNSRIDYLFARTEPVTQSTDGLMLSTDKVKLDKLEVGARNLLLRSADPDIYNYDSSSYSTQGGVSVSAWGATDATRVFGTGGGNHIAFYIGGSASCMAYGLSVGKNNQAYTASIFVKNNHATEQIGVRFNVADDAYTYLEPGASAFIINKGTGNGLKGMNIFFSTGTAGKAFDVTLWHPMIEEGTLATDWTPAPEDIDYVKEFVDGYYDDFSHVTSYSSDNVSGNLNVKCALRLCTVDFNQTMVNSAIFVADTDTETGIILDDDHIPYTNYAFMLHSSSGVNVAAKINHSTGKLTLRPIGQALPRFDYLYGCASYFV